MPAQLADCKTVNGGHPQGEPLQTDRTAQSFLVPVQEIRDNKYDLSISRYKKVEHEEVAYEPLVGTVTKLANQQGEVIYTPPEGESVVRDKLANLETFIYADDNTDPLVKLAIHYQFEAIHPFTDGNGRTGRIINILYLIEHGLLDIPILYLSRYIIDHKNAYYSGLRRVTESGEWEPWILYVLEAVEQMAKATREKILAIRDLMLESGERAKIELPKIYSKELMEVLFRLPYCKIRFLESAGIAQRKTASLYLRELERIGLLRGVKEGRGGILSQ